MANGHKPCHIGCYMKKIRVMRWLFCTLIILFLVMSPRQLIEAAQYDLYEDLAQITKPQWQGRIVIYHIVTAKTYQGSVTYYLKCQAEAFAKMNRGIFIEVIGMDEATYLERMSYGRRPDAYSFFAGSIYPEQLQSLTQDYGNFVEGLPVTTAAVPYFFSGYAMCHNEQATTRDVTSASDIQAARNAIIGSTDDTKGFIDGSYENAILDFRSLGDCIRSEKIAALQIEPLDNFTDAVCYLGIDKQVDAEKAYWTEQFFLWLLSDKAQEELTAIGAFSVRNEVKQVFASAKLNELKNTYGSVSTFEPFAFYSNKDKLFEDAQLTRQGDESAKSRFFDRLAVVLFA